jgi:SAM-dependent methyltransferase
VSARAAAYALRASACLAVARSTQVGRKRDTWVRRYNASETFRISTDGSPLRVEQMKMLAIALLGATAATQTHRLPQPGVRYVPSPQSVVDAMLELAHVTASDVVYDLGSGDGRIPITAAQRYGARGVGVEIERRLVDESNDNAKKAHVTDRVTFIHGNLFETDVRPATVIVLFLLPRMLDELLPTLKHDLRPGARIVTHGYDFGPSWPPEVSQDISGLNIHLWTIR